MSGSLGGYGSLLILAGIIGFMVWSHSRGGGCCGGHAHGEGHGQDDGKEGAAEKPEVSGGKAPTRGGSCH